MALTGNKKIMLNEVNCNSFSDENNKEINYGKELERMFSF